MTNALTVIEPYWWQGTWVFDDKAVGLDKEPFVKGVPAIIDELVKDIPNAHKGFRLLFSTVQFPNYQLELVWLREEYGGNWYKTNNPTAEGWLCPALFRYYQAAPKTIYVAAEPSQNQVTSELEEVDMLKRRIEELEQLVGKLTLENELLRKAKR
jgi:hypothetical protein